MTGKNPLKLALIGNPNTGKSSLFNALTGLNQKTANFPGITVEKNSGTISLGNGDIVSILDLPGTYSLYPKSKDEAIPCEVLLDKENQYYPEVVLFVADATNLGRNLVLLSQIIDLEIPVILTLNMIDQAEKEGMEIDTLALEKSLGIPVIKTNARKKTGIDLIRKKLEENIPPARAYFYKNNTHETIDKTYREMLHLYQPHHSGEVKKSNAEIIQQLKQNNGFDTGTWQRNDLLLRYKKINEILRIVVKKITNSGFKKRQEKLDAVLTHKTGGFLIFFSILFIIFQAIFSWAEYPMHRIEDLISFLQNLTRTYLPQGVLTQLMSEGVLSGLGGVLVFIPQIAFLSGFIAIMEDTGYLARVAFMMDKLMRPFGLNGKSIIPLMSGTACAVPAIMGARNIEHSKSRLITILVTPLMSCSARLPVYILLIGLVVPDKEVFGFLNLRGLTLMGMYMLGFLSALGAAFIYKMFIRIKEKQYFIMELPVYRMPNWNNVGISVYRKTGSFISEAGKVIVAISVILWFLASFSLPGRFDDIEKKYTQISQTEHKKISDYSGAIKAEKLEKSFAGIIGKTIEPAIAPLGFDWKIGIAIITSFAAREVFVGTMATIYGLESDKPDFNKLKEQMLQDENPHTGKKIYSFATVFSLMVFYAFALQCMSTVAVTYKETASRKWTAFQFCSMAVLAWLAAFFTYSILT